MAYLVAVLLLMIFTGPAHAYLDPGSGSYMLQLSLAGVLAIVFSLKLFWQRMRERAAALLHHRSRPDVRPGG